MLPAPPASHRSPRLLRAALRPVAAFLMLGSLGFLTPARAAPADPSLAEARAEFARGTELVRDARWAEALSSFERSATLRPHSITRFNIGACLRGMGRYTRARLAFREALARNASNPGELPAALVKEAEAFLGEIEQLMARAQVTVAPADATIAVDGQPLARDERADSSGRIRTIAGILPPGPGTQLPASSFEVALDPGPHVFLITRKGFANVVVNRSFAAGSSEVLDLRLDHLPATLHVGASAEAAVVTLDGLDVGVAPVELTRPAGTHRLEVRKEGFLTYKSDLALRSGERVSVKAELARETTPLTRKWWFWTAAGVLVAGVAAGTYYATRPEPQQPPLNGGGLGWVVPVQ